MSFLCFLHWDRETGVAAQTQGFQYALCYHSAASHPPRAAAHFLRTPVSPALSALPGICISNRANSHSSIQSAPPPTIRLLLSEWGSASASASSSSSSSSSSSTRFSCSPTTWQAEITRDAPIVEFCASNGNWNCSLADTDFLFSPRCVNFVFIVMYFPFWVKETTTEPFMSH